VITDKKSFILYIIICCKHHTFLTQNGLSFYNLDSCFTRPRRLAWEFRRDLSSPYQFKFFSGFMCHMTFIFLKIEGSEAESTMKNKTFLVPIARCMFSRFLNRIFVFEGGKDKKNFAIDMCQYTNLNNKISYERTNLNSKIVWTYRCRILASVFWPLF